jgi:DNA-binding response OmpR family regulator
MKKKILIVDDDESVLLTTKSILEMEGYDVQVHAQSFGTTNAIRDMQPDLVLLDINMPALSGDKLAEIIYEKLDRRHAPIIFYSSNDEDSLRKAVRDRGVLGYICKGDVFDLKRKVAVYLSK